MKSVAFAVRHLRINLLRCLALLVASGLLLFAVSHTARQVVSAHAEQEARHNALSSAIESAPGDAARAELGEARYRELLARGAVGPERRSEWLQLVAQLEAARRVASVEYELLPQQPARVETLPAKAGRHEILASPMRIRMNLLHERDLLDFFDELGKAAAAIPRVLSCKLERIAAPKGQAGLAADCELDWITLRQAG
jgi:hypothetical protein